MKENEREIWIDYIKVFACLLVALGHFFQSLLKANIIHDSCLYEWFNTTIYYFHVPLFFICSGYLYQKYTIICDVKMWINNKIRKLVVLGIPYFVFSFVTWGLKHFFSASVNGEEGGLIDVLLFHPTAPYWFLYVLFFIFLITPNVQSKIGLYVILAVSVIMKTLVIVFGNTSPLSEIYLISKVFENEIWFAIGMLLTVIRVDNIKHRKIGIAVGICFIVASTMTYNVNNPYISFTMGIIACCAVILLMYNCNQNQHIGWLAKYTMPIFLMHTLVSAPIRIILMKSGIYNPIIHTVIGIGASVFGPIIVMEILKIFRLDAIVYPQKLSKRGQK